MKKNIFEKKSEFKCDRPYHTLIQRTVDSEILPI